MNPEKKDIVMAKKVARKWLEQRVKAEYRVQAYSMAHCKVRNLPSLLKAFRDGKVRLVGVPTIPDLGIRIQGMDSIEFWSSDEVSLKQLQDWLEKRGLETSGIW